MLSPRSNRASLAGDCSEGAGSGPVEGGLTVSVAVRETPAAVPVRVTERTDATLVVETVQVQMPYTYFHGAPSLSEEARYVERIRMVGDQLVNEWTIEDPVTLTSPWKVTINLVRERAFDRMVQMDFSNDRTGSPVPRLSRRTRVIDLAR